MAFHAKQLPSGRWGIYSDAHLLATVGCPQMVFKMFRRLAKNNNPVDVTSIQHGVTPEWQPARDLGIQPGERWPTDKAS